MNKKAGSIVRKKGQNEIKILLMDQSEPMGEKY